MADRLHQGSSGVDAGTPAARSNARATVTNRLRSELRGPESVSPRRSTNPPHPPGGCLFCDEAADVFWLHLGELALLPVTSQLTLGRDPHSAPSSTHSLLISLSYRLPASPIYYLSATVQDSECNSRGE